MPGVLLMEAMAQTTAVLLLNKDDMRGKIGYYGGINKAKFRKKVVPGSLLRMEVAFSPLFCLISALIKSILIFYRKKMGNCDRL